MPKNSNQSDFHSPVLLLLLWIFLNSSNYGVAIPLRRPPRIGRTRAVFLAAPRLRGPAQLPIRQGHYVNSAWGSGHRRRTRENLRLDRKSTRLNSSHLGTSYA